MLPVPVRIDTLKRPNLQATSSKSNTVNFTKNFHFFCAKKPCRLNLNDDQAGQVVQQNVPAGAQATLAFKVEQSKVPEFIGQKSKGTISAIVFIRRIDNLARTNNWNDTTTNTYVANTLRSFARGWLYAMVEMLEWEGTYPDFNGNSQCNQMTNLSTASLTWQ
jgi:hypothetical protein